MYQKFSIVFISADLIEKRIAIEFTHDVDGDTVTLDTLTLLEKESSRIVDVRIHTKRNFVYLELLDWPNPNTEYMLLIQKGIKSIVNDELPDSLQRSIYFKSEVTSAVEVRSPSDYEEINELFISWVEKRTVPSENLVNSYYIEIAKDNAFYNIIQKTEVHDRNDITLSLLPPGQYYLRIRAQKNGHYGRWSDTVTFVVKEESRKPPDSNFDDGPIFEEELEVVMTPVNGETPKSFIIEFNEEIDPESIENIIVTRRSI